MKNIIKCGIFSTILTVIILSIFYCLFIANKEINKEEITTLASTEVINHQVDYRVRPTISNIFIGTVDDMSNNIYTYSTNPNIGYHEFRITTGVQYTTRQKWFVVSNFWSQTDSPSTGYFDSDDFFHTTRVGIYLCDVIFHVDPDPLVDRVVLRLYQNEVYTRTLGEIYCKGATLHDEYYMNGAVSLYNYNATNTWRLKVYYDGTAGTDITNSSARMNWTYLGKQY